MLLTTIIIKIQESSTHFFPTKSKSFGDLLDISPKNFISLKTFDSKLLYIEIWLNDQNSKPLEREDETNIPLVIN